MSYLARIAAFLFAVPGAKWALAAECSAAMLGFCCTLFGHPWLGLIGWAGAYIVAKVRDVFPLNMSPW